MSDDGPYRLTPASRTASGARPARTGALRSLLWAVLVVSVTANMVVSSAGVASGVNLACGLVTAVCVVGLVLLWTAGGRRRGGQARRRASSR
ncbi:hypothetical protein [Streptomyces sp. PU-14G]|uniref:hypothetical protein n=1 Tax=Streptomyces sp. PU-14G TaxID=2800808 RepID=UPI0034DFD320